MFICPNCGCEQFTKKNGQLVCSRCGEAHFEEFFLEREKQDSKMLSNLKNYMKSCSGEVVDTDEVLERLNNIESKIDAHRDESKAAFSSIDSHFDDIKKELSNQTLTISSLIENASKSSGSSEASFIYKSTLDEILNCVKDKGQLNDSITSELKDIKSRLSNLSNYVRPLVDDINSGKLTVEKAVEDAKESCDIGQINDVLFALKNELKVSDEENTKLINNQINGLKSTLGCIQKLIASNNTPDNSAAALNKCKNEDDLAVVAFKIRNAVERMFKKTYNVPHTDKGFYTTREKYMELFGHEPVSTNTRTVGDVKYFELPLNDRLQLANVPKESFKTVGSIWGKCTSFIHGNDEKIAGYVKNGISQCANGFKRDIDLFKNLKLLPESF